MTRSAASDVFTAIAEGRRREILDALLDGEKSVGEIVTGLSLPQPQVSKHLRVLSTAGLVRCRVDGRHRYYRLELAHFQPFREWMAKYEQAVSERLDRIDDYLRELQREGAHHD